VVSKFRYDGEQERLGFRRPKLRRRKSGVVRLQDEKKRGQKITTLVE